MLITHKDFDLDMTLTLTWPCYGNKMLTSNLNDTIGTLPIRLYENLMNISLQQIFYIHNYIHSFLFIQPIYHNILKNEDCTLRNLKNKGFSKLILTLTEIWPVSRDVCKVCHIIFDFKYPFLGIVWVVQDYCW